MTEAAYPIDPETLLTETAAAKALGQSHATAYQSGEPYHHICIDNFLPTAILDNVRADLAKLPDAPHVTPRSPAFGLQRLSPTRRM